MIQTPREPFPESFPWLIALLLILSTLVVYWPVRHHQFIDFDDDFYVVENPYVQGGLTPEAMIQAFTTANQGPNWHPLTWLSHMLDYEMYAMNPGGHHVTNLLFHLANTLLLFFVFRRMTGKLWHGGFIAALFALHPLHVESVAWAAERKDVLSTFFWMLTLLAYIRYARISRSSSSHLPSSFPLPASPLPSSLFHLPSERTRSYLLVVFFFVLGLMSKPMLVTLPFVLLLLDYWPLCRIEPDQWKIQAWPLIREKIPLFSLSAAWGAMTFLVQRGSGLVVSGEMLPLSVRVPNVLVSYIAYLWKMILPERLALYYPYPQTLPYWKVAGATLLLIVITTGVIRLRRTSPCLAVGWFWYLGTLVPVIGLVQVGGQCMADRYAYVPLIGPTIMIAMGATGVSRGCHRRMFAAFAAAALMGLLVTARIQVSHWQNSTTIFEHSLRVTGDNYFFHTMLGAVLDGQGKGQEAIAHFREALRIKPYFAHARNLLGMALEKQGNIEEAMISYREALRIKPNYSEAHYNLANLRVKLGNSEEAIAHYREALRIKPDFAAARYNLGTMLVEQGRAEEAIFHLTRALSDEPDIAEAHNNLGNLLYVQGRTQEALSHFVQACRIKPNYAEPHYNLGVVFARHGDRDLAAKEYETLWTLSPDLARRLKQEISKRTD